MSVVQPTSDLLENRRVSTGPMALSKFSCFMYIYYTFNGMWRRRAASLRRQRARSDGGGDDYDGYNILLLERNSCCY